MQHQDHRRACRATFGPHIGVALAGLAGQPQLPPTSAAHKCFQQQKKTGKKLCVLDILRLPSNKRLYTREEEGAQGGGGDPNPPNVFALARLAFGPKIGVALAGLAGQPQLPPTSAAHKCFQKKTGKKLCVLDILRLPSNKR